MTITEAAKKYRKLGISIIPVNKNKQPIYKWYEYTEKIVEEDEIENLFKDAEGIGVVCGSISSPKEGYSLMVVDVDVKYFDGEISYQEVEDSIPNKLLEKLFISETQSGGFHWWMYVPTENGKNKKFAMRETSNEELLENPLEKVKVLIENRHNGGFIVAPPTEGYKRVSDAKKIPYLDIDEYYTIIDAMGSFNRVWQTGEALDRFIEEKRQKFLISPFEDFNNKTDVLTQMYSYGYSKVGKDASGRIKLKRPSQSHSSHSGYYEVDNNRYLNFSTSTEFETGKSYSPIELYVLKECNGDWKLAYRNLVEMGYGIVIDFSSEMRKVHKKIKNNDVEWLMNYIFAAEKIKEGVFKVNHTTVKLN